ncbi:unnamed protein product [Calypogeia fissa]
MASAASLSFWRCGVSTRFGHLGSHVKGLRKAGRQQAHRRFFLAISAKERNAEEIIRAVKIKSAPRKANELACDRVFNYIQAHTREPEILREMRLETSHMRGSQMQVTPDQAQLLAMLVQLMGAKQCIEVGVFHGYSSLAVALVLPESGRLVAIDRSEESLAVAEKYFKHAGVSHKVDIRLGLAVDSLTELLQEGAGRFDFAFIDADKRMYPQYYELLLKLVRPGGLVVVDNVLWHGTVADPLVVDPKTQSIRDFNNFLLMDDRIDYNMVAIGDGMALCRKL